MGKISKKLSISLVFILIFLVTFLWTQVSKAETLITRLAGKDRYETAAKISDNGWQTSKNVVLTSGVDFPDALCAAPLAKSLDAPILLTEKDSLSSNTIDEIKRLNPDRIFIVGGTGVISTDIENNIKEISGATIERLYGNNRYDTSMVVANYIENNFAKGNEIVVVNGEGFADALSIAPIASRMCIPIILVQNSELSSAVTNFITNHKISKSYIIGGTSVVNDDILNNLPSSERIWGADRYETNVNVFNRFKDILDLTNVYVASGEGFADALSGSALASKNIAPVILTSKYPRGITKKVINDLYLSEKRTNLYVLGGEGVVPETSIQALITNSSGAIPIVYDSGATIKYPLNGAVVDPGNITVQWDSLPRVNSYTINAFEKGTALGWHGELSGTSYTIGPLLTGRTYCIEVTALSDAGIQYIMPTVTISTKLGTLNLISSPINNAVYKRGKPIKLIFSDPFNGALDEYNEVDLKGIGEGWALSVPSSGYDITQGMALQPGKYSVDMIFHHDSQTVQSAKVEFYIEN